MQVPLTTQGFRASGVLMDLDGTLLDSSQNITHRTADAVRKAAAIVPVAIATGREPADVVRFARALGLRGPQVADNGARIVDPVSGMTMEDFPMAAAAARRAVSTIEGLGFAYYAVDSGTVARSFGQFASWRVTVIAAHAASREACELLLSEVSNDEVNGVASTDASGEFWYANFCRAGVDKGWGAARFCELARASPEGLVVIGDSHNDLPMFLKAAVPVAMGHARPEIRQAASYVVGDIREDGVAQALEALVIGPAQAASRA